MAALILPSRRVVQPQGALAANISSPLARDMRFLWAHGSDRDLVKGTPYAIAGTAPAETSTTKGFAKVGAGSGNLNFGLRTDLGTPGTNQLSVMAVAYIDNSAAAIGAFMGRVDGAFCFTLSVKGGAQQFTFGINEGSTVAVPAISVAGGLLPTNKRPVVIVGTYNGATANLYVETFGDGAFKQSNSSARTGNFPSNPSDPFSLLSRGGTGERLDGASVLAGGVWGRALHRNEVDSILENPWQLFRPTQRRVWVPVAGGGGISQTVAFTLEDVSAAVSQNLSHAQSLTGTLDDVTVSISQTAQHSQALSATLDDIAFAASQTLGNATNQTLAITLDGVTVAAAQTLSHSQSLDASLDGVTFAASQTLSHSQALAATLDGITVAISQSAAPSSKEQSLAVVLDGIQVAIAQEGPANLIDTHDGFWAKEWKRIRAREKRKYQEEIQERVEEIQDEIAEVEQQIVEVKQAPKPKKATPARDFYSEQARIVEHLIARRNQLIDEEDEELLLLL